VKISPGNAVLFLWPWMELNLRVYPETLRLLESKAERFVKVCLVVDAYVLIRLVTYHIVIIEANFETRYRRWRRFSVLNTGCAKNT
jgi:hypothetical protein